MRRIGAWRAALGIDGGPLFRRVAAVRFKARAAKRPADIERLGWNAQLTEERLRGASAEPARVGYTIGDAPLSSAAVRLMLKPTALRAADLGLVKLWGKELEDAIKALSTHSLRVGLTQDLFANGVDAGPIAQALRWTSTATALKYGRELVPPGNATARILGPLRS